jgi:excinuclease ABC subunit C
VQHSEKIRELTSLWIEERWTEGLLGQFLVRKLLRGVKQGKVYTSVHPQWEEHYARIGFRYVLSPPKFLAEQLSQERIVMLWEAHQNKVDASLTARPDLLVIDGGKGQLGTAVEVLRKFAAEIPAIGLAKREEEVFLPGRAEPVSFPADSPAKFLLMRLRDEAHRFSNRHREMRHKAAMREQFEKL